MNVSTGSNNVAIGSGAGDALTTGVQNVLIGKNSGGALTVSHYNVIIGDNAGSTDTANLNNTVLVGREAGAAISGGTDASGTVAIGSQALASLTDGNGNTAIGYQALEACEDGDGNTAVGYEALLEYQGTTNHGDNTAVGFKAGQRISSGTQNTFLGYYTGIGVNGQELTGDHNTAVGNMAGKLLQVAAHENTFVGSNAGDVVTTGSDNICIGYGADTDDATATNQIVIGHSTTGVADNSVTLGNASVTTCYIGGGANSDYSTDTHGAATYAKSLHLKESGLTYNSGGVTSLLKIHGSFDDSPSGDTGIGMDFVLSAEDSNNGAVMGAIHVVSRSGVIGSGGASYGTEMQFWNKANGGIAKQLMLQGGDDNIAAWIFGNAPSRYALNVVNDGDNANRYGIDIDAGADDASGTTAYINCNDGNGDQVGHISNTSGTFALTDPSDSRLKKNIVDTTLKGVETVDKMKVRDFEWIKSGDKMKAGFIAQELAEAFPSAVTGEDGAMEDILDEDGNKTGERIKPMGVSRDVLVPVLVKAVQELSAEVKSLKQQLKDK